MVECLCVSYAEEYGVPVKIARLSQSFGAGVEYNDGRVFAEFARCAIEKKNIVLHTEGKMQLPPWSLFYWMELLGRHIM